MANSDYDREREIDEIGRDKVASNNKKHAMNVKKRKEELAKKVGASKQMTRPEAEKQALKAYHEGAAANKRVRKY